MGLLSLLFEIVGRLLKFGNIDVCTCKVVASGTSAYFFLNSIKGVQSYKQFGI